MKQLNEIFQCLKGDWLDDGNGLDLAVGGASNEVLTGGDLLDGTEDLCAFARAGSSAIAINNKREMAA